MTVKPILFMFLLVSVTSASANGPAGETDPNAQLPNNGQPVQKKCVSSLQKLDPAASQAELAKRAEEIRQIEEAKRRQQQIGFVHEIVTPIDPPVPGTNPTAGRIIAPPQPQQQEKCQ